MRLDGASFLMKQDHSTWPLNEFIQKLLYFILTRNYFIFMDQIYLQDQGVAMGTSCVASYANIYLGGWERMVFAQERFTIFVSHVLCWHRFIDDLFIIWTGPVDLLINFIDLISTI